MAGKKRGGAAGTELHLRGYGRGRHIKTMTQWSVDFLRGVLEVAPEGIVVCESRQSEQIPIYVNAAFERLCGYTREELLGQDLRRLQAWDREQEGRTQLREAIARGESARAVMRNYRKDG